VSARGRKGGRGGAGLGLLLARLPAVAARLPAVAAVMDMLAWSTPKESRSHSQNGCRPGRTKCSRDRRISPKPVPTWWIRWTFYLRAYQRCRCHRSDRFCGSMCSPCSIALRCPSPRTYRLSAVGVVGKSRFRADTKSWEEGRGESQFRGRGWGWT